MTIELRELIRQANELPESDRATLAAVMIESLEPPPTPAVKAAWSTEIDRRVAELEAGSVELLDWEQVRSELLSDE